MVDTELSVENALRLAMRLHQEGRVQDAYTIYGRVLEIEPEQPHALHYLGIMAFQQGQHADALLLMRRSIEVAPENPGFRTNFGNLLFARERYDEAEEQYRAALVLDPEHIETLNNLGVLCKGFGRFAESEELLKRVVAARPDFLEARGNLAGLYLTTGRVQESIEHYCEILIRDPAAAKSRELLGIAYYLLGRMEEAAELYEEWLAEEPDNPVALHHLSACTGRDVPLRASDDYIRQKFDSFSESFDAKLAELEYRAPGLVVEAVRARLVDGAEYAVGLDAGCGTGLCGPLLRSFVGTLIGVDLSPGMLAMARERSVYDELVEAELTAYIASQAARFDLIVSADTLVYFGALDQVFFGAAGALSPGGTLCFTVEALADEDEEDFRLLHHGRYAHARSYLERMLSVCGLQMVRLEKVTLRLEANKAVEGWLVVAEAR